ncbi:hypothetical protein QTG54_010813 [Skeletonema marinoi]|uniref:Uncharacterized protein n=1 Tax=Skeletonema marinoi TaxID=267567 RepID=A0AAD8Y405_9STRA|nr:hypothetical protein QTG54_010813 [Skeletonema marinoi]
MMKPALHLISLLFTISPIISSSANNDAAEATRYSTLPPTVFAPGGRLFGVERVAREAMGQQPSTTTEDDSAESCCTVFAIRCGVRQCSHDNEKDNRGELTIMVGIGPISPSLYRDVELYQQSRTDEHVISEQESRDNDDADEQQISTNTVPFYKPLLAPEQQSSSSSSLPISILSPTLITATGGNSIDSSILLRRSIEVALSLYKLDNGGIDFFASHSLEGTTMLASTSTISGSGGRGVQMMTARGGGGGGGASGVMIEALVRRIADMAQSSTQNLGGKYGRMLSSSLLAMGVQQSQHETVEQNHDDDDDNRDCRGEEDDTLCIWRVDPTGQFWKCDASAVGRGTVEVETELLSRVRRWKKNEANMKKQRIMVEEDGSSSTSSVAEEPTVSSADDDDDEMKQVMITNNDVRSYLSSLTEDVAVSVASDCLVNGIMNCKGAPSYNHHSEKRNGGNSSSLRDWMEYDLRRRMQCVILRSSCSSKQSSMKSYEIVRRL